MNAAENAPGIANANAFLAKLIEVECIICEEPFSVNHAPVILSTCHHIFGSHCLRTWVLSQNRGHNRCPTCRAVLFDDGLPLVEQEEDLEEAARTAAAGRRRGANAGVFEQYGAAAGGLARQADIIQPPRPPREDIYGGNFPRLPPRLIIPGRVAQAPPVHYQHHLEQLALQQAMQQMQAYGVPPGQDPQAYGRELARNILSRLREEEQRRALEFHARQQYTLQPYNQPQPGILGRDLRGNMGRGDAPSGYDRGAQPRGSFSRRPPASQFGDRLPFLREDLPLAHYLTVAHAGILGYSAQHLQGEWPYQYPAGFPAPNPEYVQLMRQRLEVQQPPSRQRGEEGQEEQR